MRSIFINVMPKTYPIANYKWLLLLGSMCLLFIVDYSINTFIVELNRRCDNDQPQYPRLTFTQEIEVILQQQRLEIEKEMKGYPYDTVSGKNIRKLSDLVIERGGNPVRSVIVSTWRSGSTFLGDFVNAHPASYYTFEPLLGFGKSGRPMSSTRPLAILRSLFTCNFSNMGDFLEYRKFDPWHHDDSNRYLKVQCHKDKNLCHDAEFSSGFCRLFPFQVMKIIYSDLASMDDILKDKDLGVKTVYLVRDSRGVMNSRKDLFWCKMEPNCIESASLCSNMLSDYTTVVDFSKRYADTFKVLRYEDLTSDPWKFGRAIYSFYGIDFHEDVKKFMNNHMNVSHDYNPYSTYKNSRAVAFQWRDKLSFGEVDEIQQNCRDAMNVWGYNLATDGDHQKTFDPVSPLSATNISYFQ